MLSSLLSLMCTLSYSGLRCGCQLDKCACICSFEVCIAASFSQYSNLYEMALGCVLAKWYIMFVLSCILHIVHLRMSLCFWFRCCSKCSVRLLVHRGHSCCLVVVLSRFGDGGGELLDELFLG